MGAERLDPGIELLFRQFLGKLVDTALPQALADIEPGWQGVLVWVSLWHFSFQLLWIVIGCCAPDCNLSKPYPHLFLLVGTSSITRRLPCKVLLWFGKFAIIDGSPDCVRGDKTKIRPN